MTGERLRDPTGPAAGAGRRAGRAAGRSGVRPGIHRPHGHDPLRRGQGLVRRPRRGPGADPDGPGHGGAALRPGDLRGAQGVPQPATAGSRCSAPTPTPAASAIRRSGWRWRSCRRSCSSARSANSSRSTGSGCRPTRRGRCTCGRSCTRARSFLGVKPVVRVPLRAHRLAGRLVLQERRQAGDGVGLVGVHPGRAGRHRRGQVRRQLRGQPGRPGRGDRPRLRPGRLPRRRRAPVDRRTGRDERLLRLRRRQPGHAAAQRQHPARASRATRC